MEDIHLTPELLDALVKYELPPDVLSHLVWKHLMALCPECKRAFDEWSAPKGIRSYRSVLDKTLRNAEEVEQEHRALKKKIGREFAELMRTPEGEREEKVRRARRRFSHPLLVDRLLEEVKGNLHGDPRQAVHFATVALLVAGKLEDPKGEEHQILAAAHLANSLRASGDLAGAEEMFEEVRELMRESQVVETEIHAKVDHLEGSLRKDQVRLEEARKLLARSALIYRLLRQEIDAARVLLTLSYVYLRLGRDAEALEVIHQVIGMVDPTEDLELAVGARQNLASALCEIGDPSGASKVLDESRTLFEEHFRHLGQYDKDTLLLRWLEGRIARGLEVYDEAEEKLRSAARGYGRLGHGYDAALVCLDLAETYLAQGKSEQVARLAEQSERLLVANDLSQEATAALLLFQQAAAQKILTRGVIEKVRKRIEEKGSGRGLVN